MTLIVETEEILKAAVVGIPKVSQTIAAIPVQYRENALAAAERSYLQTFKDSGCAEAVAKNWVSAVMERLRVEVEKRVLAHENLLKALDAELGQAVQGQG
jgi:hypothetical protein